MINFKIDVNGIKNVTSEPGIYKFFDAQNKIIYVGKAKDLKKRIASYFLKNNKNRKTLKLVSEIKSIEITIVNSEFDALLLENNLIKENQPKYNILLKDDKTFPSIVVTNDRFPKIFSIRRVDYELGEYFGPYSSVKIMKNVLELLHKLYKIRTCNLNLTELNIQKRKFKICLEYHIGNCLGPCEGFQSQLEYMEEIKQAKLILKGKSNVIIQLFKEKMNLAVSQLDFEKAQSFKDKIELLQNFQSKSLVVNPNITQIDVITLIHYQNLFFINYIKIDDGSIRATETVEVKTKMEESNQEIIEYVLPILQAKFHSQNKNIISNIAIENFEEYSFMVPQIGDKKHLIELSLKNAFLFQKDKITQKSLHKTKEEILLEEVKSDFKLKDLPYHIECFDNSNLQGTNPVSAMVCFKNGKPSKKDYRKYNINTVVGPDDFSSMKEVIYRRYYRLINENQPLPQLIIVDGGKGQLGAAIEALQELNIYGQVAIISIAKRLEEIYYPNDQHPLLLNKKSQTLKLVQQLRDEAHRFSLTFHKQKRSKKALLSTFENIENIGVKTKEKLMYHFKNIENIKNATLTDLSVVVGHSKAQIIKDYFNKK